MEMTNMWFMNILGTKRKQTKHMLTIFLSGLNTSFVTVLLYWIKILFYDKRKKKSADIPPQRDNCSISIFFEWNS